MIPVLEIDLDGKKYFDSEGKQLVENKMISARNVILRLFARKFYSRRYNHINIDAEHFAVMH